ncbi:hypothetical protein MMC22_008980 [Lobaria immixta]|nr:hypothetical protein [Lobaria immixta]
MTFTTIIALLSMIGSLASGVLAIAAVFISVPVFLLRAAGLMEAPPEIALAKRQVRLSRIRLIGSGLSANQWHPGRPLGPDEAALLTEELDLLIEEELDLLIEEELDLLIEEELDLLIEEELADLRAAKEEREKEEREKEERRGRGGWLGRGVEVVGRFFRLVWIGWFGPARVGSAGGLTRRKASTKRQQTWPPASPGFRSMGSRWDP